MTASSLAVGVLVSVAMVTLRVSAGRRLVSLVDGRPQQSLLPRQSLLHKGILVAVAGVTLVAVVGPTAAVLAVAAAGVVAWAVTRARARQAEAAIRVAVVELLRAVAGELRSGRPAGSAFAVAADSAGPGLRAAVAPLARVAARGDPAELADAMRAVASAGRGVAGFSRVAACWQVAATSGSALAPAVDRVADALHDEIELAQSLATALAGPRATVRLLAVLPLAGLALGGVIGARPLAFVLGTPAGLCCLALAVGFDAAGVAWARRIARRAALTGPFSG